MPRYKFPFLLFTFWLVTAEAVFAADGAGVRLVADRVSYDQVLDLVRAEGDVQASWGGATLTARQIEYLRSVDRLTASDGVQLERDGDRFAGSTATFAVSSASGVIERPVVYLKQPNLHLAGERLERSSAVDYALYGGTFTTCDGAAPPWCIGAAEINVTLEEYATARHAVFSVAGVPVFYFPYLILPVKTERQSGLLIPTIGNSTKKGFTYSQPFYWAISPSADATLAPELQSRRGVGGGAELRYLRPEQSSGQLSGFALYDMELQRTRGEIRLAQREQLTGGISLRSDLVQVTDRDYYRDFAVESGDYNRSYLEANTGLVWQGERALLGLEAMAWRNLDPAAPEVPLQRLPQLGGRLVTGSLGPLPLSFGLSGAAVRFARGGGAEGERLELLPQLQYDLALVPGINFTASGGYRLRGYLPRHDPGGSGARGVGQAEAATGVQAILERTSVVKLGDLRRLRHQLLPAIGYEYVQQRDQGQLPFFDWDDRVPGRQELVWSLASTLQGDFAMAEGDAQWRDLLTTRLSQGVLLSGERRELLAPVPSAERVGDLRLELLAEPTKGLSIWLDSRYNPNRPSLSSLFASVDFRDQRDNRLGIGYYSARQQVEYLEGRLATALLRPLFIEYRGRYSADRRGFLESFYSLEYRHQCWGVTVSYRDRPDNREVMVSFSLGGIGSLGKLKVF